ncbi:MAG: ABC transporter ATP-binding protein [Candidatus Methanomethylicaceae archaeon]
MITFKDVSYSYTPGAYALQNISLIIGDGELVAVLGENGAGKTTLVKHINGLLKPQSGSVIVGDTDTKKSTVANLARRVGLVFQNPDHQLFAETVEKELSFAMVNFGMPPEEVTKRVNWALEEFELAKYKEKPPFLLSGGERKRLALASVLSYDPQTIILDEPTTGQDDRQKTRMANLFKQLNSDGKTIIVVTHDMEFVANFIPRVILISKGKVLAEGPTEEILTQKEYLERASLLPPQLVDLSWKLSLSKPSISFEKVTSEALRMLEESRR